jgi:hypothetical protein
MNTGDLSPVLQATLTNPDGTIFSLAGCTVMFQLNQNGQVLFSKAATINDAATGVVEYDWQTGDTAHSGVCTGQFIVTSSTGAQQTFPTVGVFYVIFPIQPVTTPSELPQFTTLSEVMGHLNVQGPDKTGNYTIFGLTVSQEGIQSQVDHANKYIASLVPSLIEGSVDPRLPSAELAATDLACMGVLVSSVGGALVGAYDYFLGDMRVARSGPYASAIKMAINGYSKSAASNLKNLSTVAVGAKANLSYRVPRFRDRMF